MTLSRLLRCVNWLRLSLIFTVRQPPQGAIADLLNLLRRTEQNTETDDVWIETTPALRI